ncbi:MAG: DUF3531 family protein [Synechococcaceae cyanobacterium RL_1_2]|nr:DUF3531 family protein [Synechococcaceae cyanobacterium RL_1_2]
MEVEFREFNQFNLWIWLEFDHTPSASEQQYLEEVFRSWFYLGKLGAFNAESLQIEESGIDLSYLSYDRDYAERAMFPRCIICLTLSDEGFWGRCWFDLGTSDVIALDILINALRHLSEEYLEIKTIIFGGENPDWPVEEHDEDRFDSLESDYNQYSN